MRLMTRLAGRNLRARPGQAVLLLIALCVATTSVTLALAVNETGNDSWDRLHRETNGFHIRAGTAYRRGGGEPLAQIPAPTPEDIARAHEKLAALASVSGVVAASGPWPTLYAAGVIGGTELDLFVNVRETVPARVGQPLVTSGRWFDQDADGVVLEDGLASSLRVEPGDTVTIAGRRLVVRGTAMTVSVGRYPLHQPARVWVNTSTATALRSAGAKDAIAEIEIRIARPEEASALVAAQAARNPGMLREMYAETWQEARSGAHDELTVVALALSVIATLLAGLTIATAAVLVAGRMAAQSRQVGTLKAVGVTPGQVTGVLLVEYLALAATASVIGIVAGTLLSPLLARSAPSLYGAPAAPPFTWPRAAAAIGVAVAVVALATVRPALRGVRHSTVRSLAANVRPPRRSSRIGRLAGSAGLPLPFVLGLRSMTRRPGRMVANAVGQALGIAMVIVGLALYRATKAFLATEPSGAADRAASEAFTAHLLSIIFGAATLLVALATVNAFIVAVFAARDSARNHAIMRAVGATPRQTVVAFLVAQLGAGLLAGFLGVALGIVLFNTFAGEELTPIRLPVYVYAVVVVAALVVYVVNVVAPARLLARQSVTPLLAYE